MDYERPLDRSWALMPITWRIDVKKIIDGKIYNTDTATFIGNHQYANMGDFHYEDTDLYRTPKGAFFVQGTGGAYSRWSRPCGSNGQMGGHGIQALTPTEALDWCESSGIDVDVIAQYFSVEEA